ncbi:MAG TPA: carbohydrate ABC transporter permease [Ruminococcaceae bacterium]|nr:carbohydrate ABC transporter permease [Oscillospiraceae bacterium]
MVKTGIHIRFGRKQITISSKRVWLYMFVLILVTFTAMPLVYVVVTAFKPLDELLRFPPRFFVERPTTRNFGDLVLAVGSSSVPFLRYFLNSVYVAVVTVFLTVIVSALGAYAMTKLDLPFRSALFSLIIAAMMFPSQVTQIPNYLTVNGLGLVNTTWALIIPKIAVAFNFFLMKQFCEQLPNALLEAARIDGAGESRIFRSIVFPFLKPAWASLIVFSFVSNWNDYFGPLVYITSQAKNTLPLAIQSIAEGGSIARAGAMAAATFLMTMPTVIIYTVMQRRVIETMAHSGIK